LRFLETVIFLCFCCFCCFRFPPNIPVKNNANAVPDNNPVVATPATAVGLLETKLEIKRLEKTQTKIKLP
jgi:hypothetical protein